MKIITYDEISSWAWIRDGERACPDTRRFALAVYGGAFDPPHPGHESVLVRALEWAEQVVLVPSHRHADGKHMADFAVRCRWLADLARRIDPARVSCSPIEAQLAPGRDAVYSFDLLCALSARLGLPRTKVALVIGEDNLARIGKFHRGRELRSQFGLLVAQETLKLHSSAIRQAIAQGEAVPATWQLPEVGEELMIYRGVE